MFWSRIFEITAIHNAGGIVVRVKRGDDPEWYSAAVSANAGPNGNATWSLSKHKLEKLKIHASETAWVGGDIDYTVYNNASIDDLFEQLKNLLEPDRTLTTEVNIALDIL